MREQLMRISRESFHNVENSMSAMDTTEESLHNNVQIY